MTCEKCPESRRISREIVHCNLYGINVRKDYSGCLHGNRQNKEENHEQTDNHRKPDA